MYCILHFKYELYKKFRMTRAFDNWRTERQVNVSENVFLQATQWFSNYV